MSGRGLQGIALGLLLAAPGLGAQQRDVGRGLERREEAARMVDAYIVANIQDSLGLTDDQYARVVPLVTRLQKARRHYFEKRSEALRGLRRLLASGVAAEDDVKHALEALKTIEAEGPVRAREQMEALDGVLSPLQQAKYRVFEMDVERRMRSLMRRGRGDDRREERP